MPVVKNEHAGDLMRNAVVFDLGDIRAQAEKILEDAQEAAQRIITDAHEEAARITSGAAQRGHADGTAKGMAQGHAQGLEAGQIEGEAAARESLLPRLEALQQGWTDALSDWNTRRNQQLEEGRRDVLAFSLAIAERVVGQIAACEPERVKDQVAEAIRLVFDRTRLRIRVHPRDSAFMKAHLPDILAQFGTESDARIKADPTVSRGGCIVSTPDGEVDARLETQLSRIVQGVLPEMTAEEDPLEQPL